MCTCSNLWSWCRTIFFRPTLMSVLLLNRIEKSIVTIYLVSHIPTPTSAVQMWRNWLKLIRITLSSSLDHSCFLFTFQVKLKKLSSPAIPVEHCWNVFRRWKPFLAIGRRWRDGNYRQIDSWMNDGLINQYSGGWMYSIADKWIGMWINRWVDESIDGWTDGWIIDR